MLKIPQDTIINILNKEDRPMTVRELSDKSGLGISTVNKLLNRAKREPYRFVIVIKTRMPDASKNTRKIREIKTYERNKDVKF